MKEEKDSFSRIVEENLKNYEVPYNESHWNEMSSIIDRYSAPSGSVGSPVKWIVGSGVATLAILGLWYLISRPESVQTSTESEVISVPEVAVDSKTPSVVTSSDEDEAESVNVESATGTNHVPGTDEKHSPEMKIDKYASYSEGQMKEKSKQFVDKEVEKQASTLKNEPRIDNEALATSIIVNSGIICQGQAIQFKVSREISGATYYWNFGDRGLTSRKMNPVHKFLRTGTFEVTLLVSAGEKDNYKSVHTVVVEKAPTINTDVISREITLNYPYVKVEASSDMLCSYDWKFDSKQSARGSSAEFLIEKKGIYVAEVKATAENTCSSEKEFSVNADKGIEMIVEENFTPNGDGINDAFMPLELTRSEVDFTLSIIDRNGSVVFESVDSGNRWDGTMNNSGNQLPEGVYSWTVQFSDDKGRMHRQGGKISLLR